MRKIKDSNIEVMIYHKDWHLFSTEHKENEWDSCIAIGRIILHQLGQQKELPDIEELLGISMLLNSMKHIISFIKV